MSLRLDTSLLTSFTLARKDSHQSDLTDTSFTSFSTSSDSLSSYSTSPSSCDVSCVSTPIDEDFKCLSLPTSNQDALIPLFCTPCGVDLPRESPETPHVECLEPKMLPITKGINEWIKARTADWDRPLKVVGLLATTDEGCAIYSNQTRKACEKVNVGFEIRTLEHDFEIVKSAIEQVNHDYEVDGLIIYFPLFGPDKDNELRALISPRIDIEAISPSSLAKVYTSTPGTLAEMGIGFPSHSVFPCTPLAVVRVLQSLKTMYDHLRPSGQRLSGKVISVINRSETVGRPLAAMLANEGALIFSIDIDSIHIYHRHSAADHYCVTPLPKTVETNDCLRLSDVVVSAVPSAKYKVDTAVLKTGCVCVNIATDNNFAEDVKDRAGVWVQRVGSVTIANLISNAVILRLASECA